MGCPNRCIYCDQSTITGISKIDFEEIRSRVNIFASSQTEQAQIAFYGGTFTALPKETQKFLFDIIRSISPGLTIRFSTRPDTIDRETLAFCEQNNVKVIELGVQSFEDKVLDATKRGYTSETAISACKMIRDSGLKLVIQLMPGLPGSDRNTWLKTVQQTVDLKPEYVRIYPTIVLKSTELAEMFSSGLYEPLELDECIELVAIAVRKLEENSIHVIKMGLHSDIDNSQIISGPYHPNFGELIRAEILRQRIEENYSKGKTLLISKRAMSYLTGNDYWMLKRLKDSLKIPELAVSFCSNLATDSFLFTETPPSHLW